MIRFEKSEGCWFRIEPRHGDVTNERNASVTATDEGLEVVVNAGSDQGIETIPYDVLASVIAARMAK